MFFSPCGRLTDDRNYPCAPQELNIQRSYFEGTPLFAYSASQINSYYGTQTWNEESNQLESTIRWTQTSRDSQGCVKKFDYSFTSQQFQQVHYGSCDSKFNDPCRYPSFGTQLSQAKSPDTGIPPKRRRRSRSSRKRFRSRQAAVEGFHGFYPLTASQPATEPCQHPAWAGRYFAAEFAATTCASTEVKPFLDNNNFSGGHSPWVTHDNSQNSSYLEPAMKIQGSFCKKDNMASDRRLSAGSPSRRDDPKIWKNVASASTSSTWNAQRVGEDFSFPVDPTTFFGTRAHAATKTSFNEFSKDDRNLRHCNDKDSRVFNNLPEELSPHPPKSTSRRKRRHKSKVKKMREASVTVTGPVRILISNAFNKRPKKSRCVSEESGKTDVGLKTPLTSGLLSKQERRHSSHKVTRTPLTVKSEDVQESRRLSPSKSDFKPKALIKPGLRSAKKEKNKELQNIDKCDNLVGKQSVNGNENRKLVQKTLDSFFCKNLASEFRDNNLSIPNTIDSEKKCHLRLQSKSRSKNCRTTKHTHKYGSDNSNQSSDMKSHIRRIYQDEGQSSVPRLVVPVVHLRPLSESEVKNECSPVTQDATGGPALRANNTTRMALVAPIVSPFKQESCCSPTRDKGCDSPTLPPEKPVFGVGSPKRGSKKRNTLESPRPGTSPCKNSGSPPRKKILRETPDDTRGEVIAGLQSAGIARPRGSPPKRREGGEAELDLPVDNPVKPTEPEDAADALLDVEGHDDEYAQVQRDESAWRAAAASAAQRNKKRHSRGHKVYAYCQVLDEHIERHPVQNEVPEIKWSKWLNPTQLRCLTLAMLGNTEVCLNYTLDGEHNVEWEDFWIMVAKRLNSSCFNPLTKLNTGLRMTVDEWKKLWLELKARLKQRTESLTLEERHHRLGSLECLLLSEDLYKSLKESNGECLGEQCPRIWCPGACVGVVWGEPSSRRGTEEKG